MFLLHFRTIFFSFSLPVCFAFRHDNLPTTVLNTKNNFELEKVEKIFLLFILARNKLEKASFAYEFFVILL
jgi:hypothetical protein